MHSETRVDFETEGPRWSERARGGELSAVFSPHGTQRRNLYLHTLSLYGASRALALARVPGVLLDFGCGTGRMLRYFAARGWSVAGTEITAEMLDEARRYGLPPGARVYCTDGVRIPLPDACVDMIWVCGVLKYSLFPPGAVCRGGAGHAAGASASDETFTPVYADIAREMYRVLKRGGRVVNLEMSVDAAPEAFTREFENAGFATRDVRVLQRYFEPFARLLQSPRMPLACVKGAARLYAASRFHFDDAHRPSTRLRDYFIVWSKD